MRVSLLGPIVVVALLAQPGAGAMPVLVAPGEPDHMAAAIEA